MSTSTTEPGRDWLSLNPAHFNATKLPRKHRKPDPDALWTAADLLPSAPTASTGPKPPVLEGQGELFPL